MLLKHSNHSIEVSLGAEAILHATKLANGFADELLAITSEIELVALFVHYCSTRNAVTALATFEFFAKNFLQDRSVYSVIDDLGLDEEQARNVLKGYYSVWSLTEPHGSLCIPSTLPALFSDPGVNLMALIGGQSGSGTNVDEARRLLDVFRPLLTDYLAKMSAFLDNEAHDSRVSILYEHGLDVLKWCTHA
ncbi:hypothetical protein EC988_005737, partial [Linderina pennispora]